jgi:large subunit GTPase 1
LYLSVFLQLHVSDSAVDGGAGRLQSVTDRHELDEFLCDALLKESEFEVQHSSMVILSSDVVVKPKADHHLFEYEDIPIPRRPAWDEDTTHEMLDKAERESFMKWRRELAKSVRSGRATAVR